MTSKASRWFFFALQTKASTKKRMRSSGGKKSRTTEFEESYSKYRKRKRAKRSVTHKIRVQFVVRHRLLTVPHHVAL